MELSSSLIFAKALIFPKSQKKSSARKSLLGAVFCIALSLVPLVVVICVTNGMVEGMTQRIIGLSSSHIQSYISSDAEEVYTAKNFFEFSKEIKNTTRKITNAYPQVSLSALATCNNYRTGIEIRGMQEDIFKVNKDFNQLFSVIDGDISSFGKNNVVIGQKISELLGLKAGDIFRVITTKNVRGKPIPKLNSFKVGAIVSSGYQELDALWVFVPIETVYSSLNLSSASYNLLIQTEDAFSTELVSIQKNLQSTYGHIANFYRWDRVHKAEFENYSSTKVMLTFIMILIVLIASINISSAIVMLVMERQNEIAILKSLGSSPCKITLSFLLASLACGFSGVLIGIPVGLLISFNANEVILFIENIVNFFAKLLYLIQGTELSNINHIKLMDPAYYLQTIPIIIPKGQIILISVLTIILSLLVSLFPCIKAGKEKPLTLLRKN